MDLPGGERLDQSGARGQKTVDLLQSHKYVLTSSIHESTTGVSTQPRLLKSQYNDFFGEVFVISQLFVD